MYKRVIDKLFKTRGNSIDALWLTFVRVVSMLLGIACIKIISVYFSLAEYGLYAQATLVISTVCSFSILGLTDAVNYFYNNQNNVTRDKDRYLGTIFGLQTIIGIGAGLLILGCAQPLIEYFKNPSLFSAIVWIAFQPLLQNFIAMLQILYVSVGRAKSVAFINLSLSLIRLLIFLCAAFWTKNIVSILALTLCCDILQVAYFLIDLNRYKIRINLSKFHSKLCIPVLKYSIPMAAFVVINALMRDTDKWVVSYFSNSEDLALYTNNSRVLPFDLLTAAFFTVLIPIVTRYISVDKQKVCQIYGEYLNIGLTFTTILVGAAIFLSKDLLLTLYDVKYLPGLGIFIIYLFVDWIRFANVTLLYSASGNVNKLLKIVLFAFGLNFLGAVLLYKFLGLYGPAIATLGSMIVCYSWYLFGGSKILNFPVIKLFNYRLFFKILFEICLLGTTAMLASNYLLEDYNPILKFISLYSTIVLIALLINRRDLLYLVKHINNFK